MPSSSLSSAIGEGGDLKPRGQTREKKGSRSRLSENKKKGENIGGKGISCRRVFPVLSSTSSEFPLLENGT